MSLRRVFVPVLLSAPLLAFACTSQEQDDGSVSEDDAARVFAAAFCDAYYACECADWENAPAFTSEAQCTAEVEAEAQQAIDEGKASDLTYDPTHVPKITAALGAMDCKIWTEVVFSSTWIDVVDLGGSKLYYGEGERGDACEDLVESNGDDCALGLDCIEGSCEEIYVEIGDPCDGGDVCAEGGWCVDVEDNGESTCQVLPPIGETCLGVGDICEFDAACNQTSKKCEPLPERGEECLATNSWAGRVCEAYAVCGDGGFCEEAPAAGEACDGPGNPWACEAGSACSDESVCVVEQPSVCGMYWEFLD